MTEQDIMNQSITEALAMLMEMVEDLKTTVECHTTTLDNHNQILEREIAKSSINEKLN